jgi:periplasmic protein TonB
VSQAVALYRVYDLPWTTGEEQEKSFRRILARSVGAVVALALVFSLLPLPERDAAVVQEIPPRFARLVVDRPPPPPPPVVREEPEPQQAVQPEPEPERVVEQRPVEPEPVATPQPEPRQEERVVEARERASVAGLLPFAEQLASLRDNEALDRLDRAQQAAAADGAAPVAERSLITSRVGSRSGGIDTAALSRNTGGGGLAGRATTQVDDPVQGLAASGPAVERSGVSDRPSRSREEIERVFDRNKGAIFALYNRALRQNPALEGKLVLRLTIASDGRVTFCEVVSSELGDPELEQRLVQRVLLFQFESKNVEPITTTKPIDFFPA